MSKWIYGDERLKKMVETAKIMIKNAQKLQGMSFRIRLLFRTREMILWIGGRR